MAVHATRLSQEQNFNVHYDGALAGGKANGSKAQKKGGVLAARKALNDISNSGKPSALQASKNHNSMNVIPIGGDLGVSKPTLPVVGKAKAQVSGRKALKDLTNSGMPLGQPVLPKKTVDKKLFVVAEEEENFPNDIAGERFLHDHQKCINSQRKALDMESFLKIIGLENGMSVQSVPPCHPPSKKSDLSLHDGSPVKFLEMEELSELMIEDRSRQFKKFEIHSGQNSPICGSPTSPKPPYVHLKDYDFPNFALIDSP